MIRVTFEVKIHFMLNLHLHNISIHYMILFSGKAFLKFKYIGRRTQIEKSIFHKLLRLLFIKSIAYFDTDLFSKKIKTSKFTPNTRISKL